MADRNGSEDALRAELREAQAEVARLHAALAEQSDERYRLLTDNLPGLFSVIRPDHTYGYANLAYARAFDRDREDIIGRHVEEVIGSELYAQVANAIDEVLGGEVRVVEVTMTGDGAARHLLGQLVPHRSPDGEVICALALITDVTAQRRAEAEISELEHQCRLLAENATDVIWTMDLQLRFTFISPSVVDVLGYAPEELIGTPIDKIATPETLDLSQRLLEQKLALAASSDPAAWTPLIVETSYVRKDGSIVETRNNAKLVPDERGGASFIVGATHDITDRKRAERALAASERRFRTIFDTDPECVKILDGRGRLQAINAAGLVFIEADSFSSVEGCDPSRHVHEEYRAAFEQLTRDVCEKRQRGTLEFQLTGLKGTTRWLDTHAVPIDAEDGQTHLLAITRDITERKKAEDERRQLEAQLQQAQKMEALGLLASGIAHDFNNTLAVICSNVELALDEPITGELRELVDDIGGAAEHAAQLTRQLVSFARKQVVKPSVLDVNEVVERLRPLLSRMLGDDISVLVSLASPLGLVEFDPHQLEQILLNLVVNARDAMPDGGTLEIETANVVLPADPLGRPAGPYVSLSVRDEGCGIPEEDRSRIFEPFFTTKTASRGSGLGLSTVFGILKQHGGSIDVVSKPGEGATFVIHLPCSSRARTTPSTFPPRPPPRGRETILLVDDDERVLQSATRMLKRLGYVVIAAPSGEDALRAMAAHEGAIDLIFTDVVMPRMDGHELVAQLATTHPELRVLFTSGDVGNIAAQHQALTRGAHFVAKPYSTKTVAESIRLALESPPVEPIPSDGDGPRS